ncbi:Uncharacterised protein [Vibrio cholerae]|nr:Uncharacterised protein [Vibrio cholerae]
MNTKKSTDSSKRLTEKVIVGCPSLNVTGLTTTASP